MPTEPPETPSDAESFPEKGRLAGIDYGTRRIGVAICDPDRILCSPVEVHAVQDESKDGAYFRSLADQERIAGWVVGLPIHCDGGESEKSKECRAFGEWLAKETSLPVRLFDERFTTAAAKERMSSQKLSRGKRKKQLDAVAALVILESFLEASRYSGRLAGQPLGGDQTGGVGLDS